VGRLLAIVLTLAVLVGLPFALFGDRAETWLSGDGAADWMREHGTWAWAAGLLLIAADILLPLPATVVMAALGVIYGPWLGGLIAASGTVLAGCIGYGICRLIPIRTAERLAGARGLAQGRALFERWGGWLVAGSRWLPVLPETVAFLAGLTRMPFARYLAALVCGGVPLGLVFASVGHWGAQLPVLALAAAALLPVALWAMVRPWLQR
jgi:uncharacterized membrane protein YdjX (TVP38/TMEM64 family)